MKTKGVISGRGVVVLALFFLVQNHASGALVPVEELGGGEATVSTNSDRLSVSESDPYYRLQLLQEELRQLRGLLEQQANELAMLKKRQREDYLDLDRRISLSSVAGAVPAIGASAGATGVGGARSPGGQLMGAARDTRTPDVAFTGSGGTEDQQAFEQAYGLLKARKIPEAKAALKKFLQDYPQGPNTGNAHYWLGELHLLSRELPEATVQFLAVVEGHPNHRKLNDAMFKLGKVYHLQNKPKQAREFLKRAVAGSGSAARLAQDYLSRYF